MSFLKCHRKELASIVNFVNFVPVMKANYRTFLHPCSSCQLIVCINHRLLLSQTSSEALVLPVFAYFFQCLVAPPPLTKERIATANPVKLTGDFIMPKKQMEGKV